MHVFVLLRFKIQLVKGCKGCAHQVLGFQISLFLSFSREMNENPDRMNPLTIWLCKGEL